MLNLNDFYYFVHVVDAKGFAAAGRMLNVPKSSLSRRIIDLEGRLSARLIQRTSRSFVLTEVGQEFYQHARAMLIEAEAAEGVVKRRLAEPSGTIRYTCSLGMAQFAMAELLTRFMTLFPKVDVVEHATNRFVDLVEEGFDAGLRGHTGALPDSGLIQRPLADTPWELFAAASYLDRVGMLDTPAELGGHVGLLLGNLASEAVWSLRDRAGTEAHIPFKPRLRSDDMATLKAAAQAGLGIVALPGYICRCEVQTGALRRVLPEWTAGDGKVTLLIPSRRGLLPSIRAFSDFLAAQFPIAVGGAKEDASLNTGGDSSKA